MNSQKTDQIEGYDAKGEGEALACAYVATQPSLALYNPQSLSNPNLMEEICSKDNLDVALKQVCRNKGSPGVDGISTIELKEYYQKHWQEIQLSLQTGSYIPQPVKEVGIPKPCGGIRKLGIPVVLDRLIQQSILQVLQRYWDVSFSEHSYGFREGRSCHQAIEQALKYINEGYSYVVDMDLEKFFDRVNHDKLMSTLAKRVEDKRVLKIIRRFLQAGIMSQGITKSRTEGTPQGGPLSPFLSNIVLDALDKELERRGHKFVRYADDCNIYTRSLRAADRVYGSICQYVTNKLKLRVNDQKSKTGRAEEITFLGFSFFFQRKIGR